MQPLSKAKFGTHVPPAIFPSIFGLLGLGLAWRRAAAVFALPAGISEMILGAVTLLFVFAAMAYGLKVSRRPGVVGEDLRVLPGRAGLVTMVLSFYLVSAGVIPVSRSLALIALGLGLALHAVLVILLLRLLVQGPPEQRQVTPIWHLSYVGFIIAPVAMIPLGFVQAAQIIFYVTAVFAVAIWGISLGQLARSMPPSPLRPLLAIHLSPAALLGTVALMLGHGQMAVGFAALASVIVVLLLFWARWITAAGFSPLWGAFTFPLAAYGSLMLALAAAGQGDVFRIAGGAVLVACTLLIPWVAFKVLQGWAKGQLAVKTNAARV